MKVQSYASAARKTIAFPRLSVPSKEKPGQLGPGKSKQSLEQMGEFLEESWGEDYIDLKGLAGQAHEGSTAAFFFASMASGMTRLMREMQVERGLSCRAVAAAAEGAAEGAASVANERMKSQRGNTDKALRQLLELLKITATLVELGRLGLRHKDDGPCHAMPYSTHRCPNGFKHFHNASTAGSAQCMYYFELSCSIS